MSNEKAKSDYVRFLIKTDNIVWDDNKSFLIKFAHNQTFFYPKALAYKQEIDLKTERLFNTVDHNNKYAKYLSLSFLANPKPYTNKTTGKTNIFDSVEIRTKQEGQIDEKGKQIYLTSKLSLWDLKKHFSQETTKLLAEAKVEKSKQSNNKPTNTQTEILQ